MTITRVERFVRTDTHSIEPFATNHCHLLRPFGHSTVQAFTGGFCGSAYLFNSAFSALECLTSLACHPATMPSADFRCPINLPCGRLSPFRNVHRISRGNPGCFPHITVGSTKCAQKLEDFGLCCTLVLRIAPHIRLPASWRAYSVRSARDFASSFLSAPLTGIQLPSATLRRLLTGTGLASLISSNFPIGLTP